PRLDAVPRPHGRARGRHLASGPGAVAARCLSGAIGRATGRSLRHAGALHDEPTHPRPRPSRPSGGPAQVPIGAMGFSGAKLTTVVESPRATRGQRLKRYCARGSPVEGSACAASAISTLTVSPSILMAPLGSVELLAGVTRSRIEPVTVPPA